MRDRYGRAVSDLRISLTQRCNLRCVFCHMEGQPFSREELTVDEIDRVMEAGVAAGIDRIKLTGGEPTLRSDVVEIVRRAAQRVPEVSMTTNGLRLAELAARMKAAGLARVNVSLPSLDPETYRSLTGVDGVAKAVAGIKAAIAAGLSPVKLNVVALAGQTSGSDGLSALVGFARSVGAWVQVIEFENVSGRVDPRVYQDLHSGLGDLTREAVERAFRVDHNRLHDRPRFTFDTVGGPVTLEVVQPVENPSFCMACHRLRLTSDGRLKGCLMTNEGLVDLRPMLQRGASLTELVSAFELATYLRRPFFTGPETPSPNPTKAPGSATGFRVP